MALFVVRHQHAAERCPAQDPYMGAILLKAVLPLMIGGGWGRIVNITSNSIGLVAPGVPVYNVGIIDHAVLHEIDLAQWERAIAVNQTAVMLGMRAVIPAMLSRRGGAIVNISSIWGSVAAGGAASYHTTKEAVRNLTKNAAVTYAKQGIRANSIHPGLIRTPIVDLQEEEKTAWVVAQTPMGKMGNPTDIASGALYLASDEAAFVTGAELYIDGGYTAQ